MLTMCGTPCCSATWAIAAVCPESNAPTSTCAPSPMRRSARLRAVSTLDSVSAFMISMSTPSRCRIRSGARSAPFWHDCPINACNPERGSKTPILSFALAPSAFARAGQADSASVPTAAPNVRRVMDPINAPPCLSFRLPDNMKSALHTPKKECPQRPPKEPNAQGPSTEARTDERPHEMAPRVSAVTPNDRKRKGFIGGVGAAFF